MRIVSGTHRSRRIQAPKNLPVRPTTDIAKEALFNVLEHNIDIEDATILDLFAGTGNISYEFASRGAKNIISVDANFHCVKFIKKCSGELDFPQITAIRSKTEQYLKYVDSKFDLIFADPPYDLPWLNNLPEMILEKEILNEDGWIIIEHPETNDFTSNSRFFRQLRYGKVNFSIFR